MGYVQGSLQPVEVCKVEMVWVAADEVPEAQEFADLAPPGPRVSFGDVEYMGPLHTGVTHSPGVLVPPAHNASPALDTPIPGAGWLMLGAALAVVAYVIYSENKRRVKYVLR